MGPRKCTGALSVDGGQESCCFSTNEATPGTAAHGNFDGRCVWCNPEELQRRLDNAQLRKLLVYNLKRLYEINPDEDVFDRAIARLPQAWAEELALKAKPANPEAHAKDNLL